MGRCVLVAYVASCSYEYLFLKTYFWHCKFSFIVLGIESMTDKAVHVYVIKNTCIVCTVFSVAGKCQSNVWVKKKTAPFKLHWISMKGYGF